MCVGVLHLASVVSQATARAVVTAPATRRRASFRFHRSLPQAVRGLGLHESRNSRVSNLTASGLASNRLAMALKRRAESKSESTLAARIGAQREPGRAEVSLERLEAEFGDASRYEIVASLKELEKAGSGQFVVGRKGQRSRFVWARDKAPAAPRAAQKAASAPKRSRVRADRGAVDRAPGLSSEPAPQGSASKPPVPAASRTLRHSFHLRPGLLVSIELPEDVSATEVARFCSFLQAIPFAGDTRR
jgi:hypothetical protein